MEKLPKLLLAFCALFLLQLPAWACLSCNRPLQVSVLDDNFLKNLFYMVLPFLVVAGIVIRIYKLK
jgi:hypothetical protein